MIMAPHCPFFNAVGISEYATLLIINDAYRFFTADILVVPIASMHTDNPLSTRSSTERIESYEAALVVKNVAMEAV